MNFLIVHIEIAVSCLCIIEALLEKYVIVLKNPSHPQYIKLNKKEHQLSALYWLAMVCVFVFLALGRIEAWYWLSLALVLIRRIFFEYTLKLVRTGKRLKDIEGDQFWDTISKKIFGKKGGYWELLVLITALLLINLVLLK